MTRMVVAREVKRASILRIAVIALSTRRGHKARARIHSSSLPGLGIASPEDRSWISPRLERKETSGEDAVIL